MFTADFLAEIGNITSAVARESGTVKNVAVNVVKKGPVYVLSIRFPRSKMIFCSVAHNELYCCISLIYSQTIPVEVGSAVDVRNTSTSPRYINPRRSNCRPLDVTVKFMVTRLKLHGGGVYAPSVMISLVCNGVGG